jgi:hypothetical protein
MKIPLSAGVGALLLSGSVLAAQPLAYPMRSQSPGQKSIDNAACYGQANQLTKVSMAHESQAPEKPKTTKPVPVHQVAVSAPLPPGIPPAASAPDGASAVALNASGKPDLGASSVPVKGPLPGMPALPPPEPPMVQYWHAYSDCMTQRGYTVQ